MTRLFSRFRGNVGGDNQDEVNTQEKPGFREGWPMWMKQLPRFKFTETPNEKYQLIDRQKLEEELVNQDPTAIERIKEDLDFMDHELLRLFRQRDYSASYQQNRYRLYQILFMVLATFATLIGSLQALTLDGNPNMVPFFALLETIVALLTTYLATISGREPPLPLWLTNRHRAENLRREYFRFLMNTPPYNQLEGHHRKLKLSTRVAAINRGVDPDGDEN